MSSSAASLSAEEYEDRRRMLERLKLLNKDEMQHIYSILKATGAEFSENSNGVFFDLCKLPAEGVKQIAEYIGLCNKLREEFAQREEEERKAQEALEGGDHYANVTGHW